MVRLDIPFNERKCVECGATTTRIEKRGDKSYSRWHNIGGKCHCWKCWKRLVQYQRYDKKYDREVRQKKRITFKDKRIRLKGKVYPRIGKCSWCPNNIADGSCRRTSLHHIEYMDGNPLDKTIEICNSCHIKETMKNKKPITLA